MNPQIDAYLLDGCGRCPLGATPACKVNHWRSELEQLRVFILDCGLKEELKWSVPCYTWQGKNVLLLSALKNHAIVGFFKGSLLNDTHKILVSPGKNSQSDRRLIFTNVQQILEQEAILKAYIFEAIEIEKAGLSVDFKNKNELVLVEELQLKLEEDPELKAAFAALTPGRQRGYNLYFSQAKQSKTRISRIEKYRTKILEGKGFHDR